MSVPKCPILRTPYQHHDVVVDMRRQVRNQLNMTVAYQGNVVLEAPRKLGADSQAEEYEGSNFKSEAPLLSLLISTRKVLSNSSGMSLCST